MTDRLLLVPLSPRVAPGLLSFHAWSVLTAGDPVCAAGSGHPLERSLLEAGVRLLEVPEPAAFRELARATGAAVWVGTDEPTDADFTRRLGQLVLRESPAPPELEVVPGSWDLPGAHLLDAVAVLDRLRSPGGCPWDAEQTHRSLLPYLLEEAYEAYQAVEDASLGPDGDLREELGDVLLQVLFHARLAEEGSEPWSVDDVADTLVRKLVRRHPHVFAGAEVRDAEHVNERWEQLKQAEKQRTSVTEGVPMAMAALALAAKLQRRAARTGLPADAYDAGPGLGGDLWRAVVGPGGDEAETALRAVARDFRDRLAAAEGRAREAGRDPATLDAAAWRGLWDGPSA